MLYYSNRVSVHEVHKHFTAAVTSARITRPHWIWYIGQALNGRLQFIAGCFRSFWFFVGFFLGGVGFLRSFFCKDKIPKCDGIITINPNFQLGWTALACKCSQRFPLLQLSGTAASRCPKLSAVGTKSHQVLMGVTSWAQKEKQGKAVWFLQNAPSKVKDDVQAPDVPMSSPFQLLWKESSMISPSDLFELFLTKVAKKVLYIK